jgi:hypothetical protein
MLTTNTFDAEVGEYLMIELHFGQTVSTMDDTLVEEFMI